MRALSVSSAFPNLLSRKDPLARLLFDVPTSSNQLMQHSNVPTDESHYAARLHLKQIYTSIQARASKLCSWDAMRQALWIPVLEYSVWVDENGDLLVLSTKLIRDGLHFNLPFSNRIVGEVSRPCFRCIMWLSQNLSSKSESSTFVISRARIYLQRGHGEQFQFDSSKSSRHHQHWPCHFFARQTLSVR